MDSFEVLKALYNEMEQERGTEVYKYVLELRFMKLKGHGTYLAKTKGKVRVLLMDIVLKNCFNILSQNHLRC